MSSDAIKADAPRNRGGNPSKPVSATEALKAGVFSVGRSTGFFHVLRDSRWRSTRLLVLCYHGVSQADEHEGVRELYVPADLFRRRMIALRNGGYRVLPLAEGLERLASGTLPPRAVALTFDDGFVDFSRVAAPILEEFKYPATVYVSTEYVEAQLPVFPPVLPYLVWKARGRDADGNGITVDGSALKTGTEAERAETVARLGTSVAEMKLKEPVARDEFAARVAQRLGLDYASIKRDRLLHLMTEQEVADLRRDLFDIQLHTHRHTQPNDRQLFQSEISDNRQALAKMGASPQTLTHFCYPNGEVRPELPVWLRELGVQSATTCVPGIADRDSDALLIPRFVDTQDVDSLKFEAWLCGAAALLPRRA